MTRECTDSQWAQLARDLCFQDERSMYMALYIEQGLSVIDIAERLKAGTATINRRMALWKIPKRSRGGARRSADNKVFLFYMDQRVVVSLKNSLLSEMVGCSYSVVYNYKRWKAGGSVLGYYLTSAGSKNSVLHNFREREIQR